MMNLSSQRYASIHMYFQHQLYAYAKVNGTTCFSSYLFNDDDILSSHSSFAVQDLR